MGAGWWSKAEVVTTEPEKVKELILQITNEGDTTGVYNIEIKGNSIFFDSDGYGRYGIEWEEGFFDTYDSLLFARLCEKYTGALICFEAVNPGEMCNYYCSSIWMKPEGVVKPKTEDEDDEEDDDDDDDDDDDQYESEESETFYIISHVLWWEDLDCSKSYDDYEPAFQRYFNTELITLWSPTFDYIEKHREEMPNLYAAYIKAKEDGFDDWVIPSWIKEKAITYEVAQQIGELYSDDQDAVIQDCFNNMEKQISDESYFYDGIGLPENFPKLSKLK
ncbi:hypothetical protein MEO94_26550 [Dolichospermum sp. ST_sed9]|nr:hypothetical protein [Dolichospermum sp. ST_sed9]